MKVSFAIVDSTWDGLPSNATWDTTGAAAWGAETWLVDRFRNGKFANDGHVMKEAVGCLLLFAVGAGVTVAPASAAVVVPGWEPTCDPTIGVVADLSVDATVIGVATGALFVEAVAAVAGGLLGFVSRFARTNFPPQSRSSLDANSSGDMPIAAAEANRSRICNRMSRSWSGSSSCDCPAKGTSSTLCAVAASSWLQTAEISRRSNFGIFVCCNPAFALYTSDPDKEDRLDLARGDCCDSGLEALPLLLLLPSLVLIVFPMLTFLLTTERFSPLGCFLPRIRECAVRNA